MHHVHTSGAIPGTLVFGWISDNYGRYTADSYQEIVVRSAYLGLMFAVTARVCEFEAVYSTLPSPLTVF
jgi:hypothetical protein